MNLHVVAYPTLAPEDLERIRECRKEHNSLYKIIGAHFTIVFSVPDAGAEEFIAEIKKQSAGIPAIRFCLRCAAINKDSFSDNYDAFLVPDEGFSQITKLHDRLYGGSLSPHHRLDVPYIPHISIANSTDASSVKRIVDEWNAKELAIEGSIGMLDIINYENRVITTIERIKLG